MTAPSIARARRGAPSQRAVLDALCLYIVQAAQLVVEADIRRLSADTGWGRTAVHTALRALQEPTTPGDPESAWLVAVGDRESHRGQRFRLSNRFSTDPDDLNRTQVRARPRAHTPSSDRAAWITHLSTDLAALSHNVFAAPHSLGRTAGQVFKRISTNATVTVTDLASATGLSASRVRQSLARLRWHGLCRRTTHGWARGDIAALEHAADVLDVAGYLEERAYRYSVERAVWGLFGHPVGVRLAG